MSGEGKNPKAQPAENQEIENKKIDKETKPKQVKASLARQASEVERSFLAKKITEQKPPETNETPEESVDHEISNIDPNKEVREQLSAIRSLKIVGYPLFAKLFEAGLKPDKVKNLSDLKDISANIKAKIENSTEKKALDKLQQIASLQNSKLYKEIAAQPTGQDDELDSFKWQTFIEKVKQAYQEALKAKNSIGSISEKSSKKDYKEDAPWYEKAANWAKKNPGSAALAGVAALMAGYCAYEMLNKENDTKEKLLAAGGFTISGLALGGILGKDTFSWIRDNKLLSGAKLDRFKELISNGQYIKAFSSLLEAADPNWEKYKDIAEKISKKTDKKISTLAVEAIADVKYSDFTSSLRDVADWGKELLNRFTGLGLVSGIMEGSPEIKEQTKILKDYLKSKDSEIKSLIDAGKLTNSSKIAEVLAALEGVEIKSVPTKSKDKKEPSAADVADYATGSIAAVSQETMNEFNAVAKNAKPLQEFLSKSEKMSMTEILAHPINYMGEFITAATNSGLTVVLGAGKVLLWNGYKFITFTSVKTLFDTAVTLTESVFRPTVKWGDSVKTYLYNASPFIIIGAGWGALTAKTANGTRGILPSMVGMIEGAGKGAIFPVEAIKIHARAAQYMYRGAKDIGFNARALSIRKPDLVIQALEEKAAFHAKIAKEYELMYSAQTKSLIYPEKWYARALSSKERVLALQKEHLKNFVDTFNELQDLKLKEATSLGKKYEKITLRAEGDGNIKQATDIMDRYIKSTNEEITEIKGKPGNYQFKGDEIPITNAELEAKINEIRSQKPLDKVTPQDLWERETIKEAKEAICKTKYEIVTKVSGTTDTYRYRGSQVEIPDGDIKAKMLNGNLQEQDALKALFEEKLLKPIEIKTKGDAHTYKFQEQEFTLKEGEINAKMTSGISREEAIKKLIYEKTVAHVTVQDVKVDPHTGVHEYTVNGEKIKPTDLSKPSTMEEIRAKFAEELSKKGISVDFQKLAKEAKYMQYFGVFEKIFGTASAVWIFYELYSATDKRKTIAEITTTLGTFYAGMKLTDWKVGSKLQEHPMKRTILDIMGGIAVTMGFSEPISKLVESFLDVIPASHAVSDRLGNILEAQEIKTVSKMAFSSLKEGVLKKVAVKAAEKMGYAGLEKAFEKKIESAFLKRIMSFAARASFKNIMASLGVRGAVAAGMIADDATVIGVLDDVIALGLIIWMGKDIIEIIQLIRNAYKVQDEMAKRTGKSLSEFKPADLTSQTAIQKELSKYGKTINQLSDLTEEELFTILRTVNVPVTFEIRRKGVDGYERWTLKGGEAVGIAIYDGAKKEIASITDKDASKIDQSLKEMEKQEKKG